MAERCTFMRGFLRGATSPEAYTDYLGGMHQLYAALEKALHRRQDHPVVRSFYFPELFRIEAIERDLEFFGGRPLEQNAKAHLVLEELTAHLNRLADDEPERLISHAYTRYMGDLSGGQILAKIVSKSMGLDRRGKGLEFYHFEKVGDIDEFKNNYRARLDQLPSVDPTLPDRIVAETMTSFRYNIRFFETLEGNALIAAFRQIFPRKKPDFGLKSLRQTPSTAS